MALNSNMFVSWIKEDISKIGVAKNKNKDEVLIAGATFQQGCFDALASTG